MDVPKFVMLAALKSTVLVVGCIINLPLPFFNSTLPLSNRTAYCAIDSADSSRQQCTASITKVQCGGMKLIHQEIFIEGSTPQVLDLSKENFSRSCNEGHNSGSKGMGFGCANIFWRVS